jgi:hypothetical protein
MSANLVENWANKIGDVGLHLLGISEAEHSNQQAQAQPPTVTPDLEKN